MRMLSYNVMQGGFESYSYDLDFPKRLPLIQKVVRLSGADFVCLIDTFRWDTFFTNKTLQDLFEYEHFFTVNLGDQRLKKLGHNNAITVMTKYPNPKFESIRIDSRNAIKTTLKVDGKMLSIFCVYLDDLSDASRVSQIRGLETHLDKASVSYILGDLNCVENLYATKVKALIKERLIAEQDKRPVLEQTLEEMIESKVFSELRRIGFKNISPRLHLTLPTRLSPLAIKPFIQLDYALSNNGVVAKSFKVIKNSLTEKASDHYPIIVEV